MLTTEGTEFTEVNGIVGACKMPSMTKMVLKQDVPVLLGIPFDANSSYLRGAAKAPPLIRKAFRCDSSNMWSETGVDLSVPGSFADAGDIKFPKGKKPFEAIERAVSGLLEKGQRPVCLGGDHSVTYPIVRAFSKKYFDLTIIHFDAHPDLYDVLDGSRLSHACPFARIMEEGCAKRLIQVGIRTLNAHQKEQAQRFGVEIVEMRALPAFSKLSVGGPVYITFDIDVLDPAFAPGISHREPGGMSVREAIAHLHAIKGGIVGADIVEFNPKQDVSGLTAMVCGRILKEILGRMIGG